MNLKMLSTAIRDSAKWFHDQEYYSSDDRWDYSDVLELLKVLARIVEGVTVKKSFGSPGDWGYDHPIGKALAGLENRVSKCVETEGEE